MTNRKPYKPRDYYPNINAINAQAKEDIWPGKLPIIDYEAAEHSPVRTIRKLGELLLKR